MFNPNAHKFCVRGSRYLPVLIYPVSKIGEHGRAHNGVISRHTSLNLRVLTEGGSIRNAYTTCRKSRYPILMRTILTGKSPDKKPPIPRSWIGPRLGYAALLNVRVSIVLVLHDHQILSQLCSGQINRCASRDHVAKDGKHERDVCDWCIKNGHLSNACMRKFMGFPRPTQKVNANEASEASGSGQTQGVATVGSKDKDSSAEKMKELEAKIALLMKEQEAIKASF